MRARAGKRKSCLAVGTLLLQAAAALWLDVVSALNAANQSRAARKYWARRYIGVLRTLPLGLLRRILGRPALQRRSEPACSGAS